MIQILKFTLLLLFPWHLLTHRSLSLSHVHHWVCRMMVLWPCCKRQTILHCLISTVSTFDLLILTGGTLLQGTGSLSANRIRAQLEVSGSQTHHVWNSTELQRSHLITVNTKEKNQEGPTVKTKQQLHQDAWRGTEKWGDRGKRLKGWWRRWSMYGYKRRILCGFFYISRPAVTNAWTV